MSKNKLPKYVGLDISDTNQKMTKKEIKHRFDNETAELYSQRKPIWLPEFEFSFDLIISALKPYIKGGEKLLDLGAGTGKLSRKVLESYENIGITLIDFSENMLAEVPNVLSDFKRKYNTVLADIFDIKLEKNHYNNVISSFAIHHARNIDDYSNLYKNIYNSIIDLGVFICVDVIEGATPYLSKSNENGWEKFLEEQSFTKQDIKKILSNYCREDSPLSIFEHLTLLKKSGFDKVDLLWKKYNFGVYMGIKEKGS